MNKKIFTVLLLAVFMLTQFSMASAASVAGTTALASLPAFNDYTDIDIQWSVTGMPASGSQYLLIWMRKNGAAWSTGLDNCKTASIVDGLNAANGTFNWGFGASVSNQDTLDFLATVDSSPSCAGATLPAANTAGQASTYIDSNEVLGFMANPPTLEAVASFGDQHVACNTFEMWSLVSDRYSIEDAYATTGYSGLKSWNQKQTGTSAAPAPVGAADDLLEWEYTLPATASSGWSFEINPVDNASNAWGAGYYFRNNIAITPAELADCKSFTDTSGHSDEVYIRYLGTLDLIAGNPDGSFSPDSTLTRAEASALFEKANGETAATLPTSAPTAACTFSDVSATDWFAGWVWQACQDGFMNGLGGGKFGPADLLTRGQIVTIFNNIYGMGGGAAGSYLDFTPDTILSFDWGYWFDAGKGHPYLRERAWIDVAVGAFYALPVMRAYGSGVAEGTSDTTFSPDQAILRGEFAKMLYRALSRRRF